jgi:hypothetical protein
LPRFRKAPNGEVRVRLHDKHAALVSIGKHLGMFTDVVQMRAVYGISEEPMSAEGLHTLRAISDFLLLWVHKGVRKGGRCSKVSYVAPLSEDIDLK